MVSPGRPGRPASPAGAAAAAGPAGAPRTAALGRAGRTCGLDSVLLPDRWTALGPIWGPPPFTISASRGWRRRSQVCAAGRGRRQGQGQKRWHGRGKAPPLPASLPLSCLLPKRGLLGGLSGFQRVFWVKMAPSCAFPQAPPRDGSPAGATASQAAGWRGARGWEANKMASGERSGELGVPTSFSCLTTNFKSPIGGNGAPALEPEGDVCVRAAEVSHCL